MRVAGFNLGTRFTMDDFDTASDIIKGNIRISLGSLEDDTEAEEREEARLEMLEELSSLRDEMRKNRSSEEVVPGEVRALDSSIDEKNGDTVEEFSTLDNKDVVGQSNKGESEFMTDATEEDVSIEDLEDVPDEFELCDIDGDASDFDNGAYKNEPEEKEVYMPDFEIGADGDTEDEDADNEFFPGDFDDEDINDGDDEENTEDSIESDEDSSIQSEIDKELAKYLGNSVSSNASTAPKSANKASDSVFVDNSKQSVDNLRQGVDKTHIVKEDKSGVNGKSIRKPNVNSAQNTRKVQEIKVPDIQIKKSARQEKRSKVDYSELTIKEINDRYLRKFMMDNGVRKAPVNADLLKKEFGDDIVKSLTTKGYIMRRGNGYIMGI